MQINPTRRGIVKGLASFGAAALPCCFAHRAFAATDADFSLREIADGVFAFQGVNELMHPENEGAICNLGVVVGADAVAVIDSGGSLVEAQAFIAAIAEVTSKPVRFLINTHMHPDHIFGNAAFRTLGADHRRASKPAGGARSARRISTCKATGNSSATSSWRA